MLAEGVYSFQTGFHIFVPFLFSFLLLCYLYCFHPWLGCNRIVNNKQQQKRKQKKKRIRPITDTYIMACMEDAPA